MRWGGYIISTVPLHCKHNRDGRTDRLTEHCGVGWVYNEHCTFTTSIIGREVRTDGQTIGRTANGIWVYNEHCTYTAPGS